MLIAPTAKDPVVLSYLALRKAVGGIAFGMPFALAIPWWVVCHHVIETSISGYYYTGMRNLFVGSLCAISMFLLCCRGYDWKDELTGAVSAACTLGVAFFPTAPNGEKTGIGTAHYIFAVLLFSTLAVFFLVLFKMSAKTKTMTRKKRQRNWVYTVCGCVILASILLIGVLNHFNVTHLVGDLTPTFCFESTALIAFGIAWLTKGETFLKDEKPEPSVTETTDGHIQIEKPAAG
jgi:hypothetical protein